MRDYEFGNHLMMLRKSQGFSQFQLGTLIGVTDKAVSKWETGTAKPKYEILLKLASILKVDLSQLVPENKAPSSRETGELRNRKKALWANAEQRLHEVYGQNPPLTVSGRFSAEKNILEKTDAVFLFDVLRQLKAIAEAEKTIITPRGSICCSFVAWLLGATVINPLPAHSYCPKCHRVSFHPEARFGWDLPSTQCECGAEAICDGHDLPFEVCICGSSDSLQAVECNVSAGILDEALKCIMRNTQPLYSLKRFVLKSDAKDAVPCHRLYLLPRSGNCDYRSITDVPVMSEEQHRESIGEYPSFSLLPYIPDSDSTAGKNCHLPDVHDLLQPEVMADAVRNHYSAQAKYDDFLQTKTPDPEPYLKDMTFGKYISLINATKNTYTVPGPEEFAALLGFDDFTKLPLSRESLWNELIRICGRDYQLIGVISEIVYKTQKGFYSKEITEADRNLFRSLNLPKWFPLYAGSIVYMFPQSHNISYGYQLLVTTWRKFGSQRDKKSISL